MVTQRFIKRMNSIVFVAAILLIGAQLLALARLVDSHASAPTEEDVSVGTGVCPHCSFRTPAEPDALYFTCDKCQRTVFGPSNILTD